MICRGAGFGRKVALAPAFRIRSIDSREIRRWPLSGFRNFHNKIFGRKSIISYICHREVGTSVVTTIAGMRGYRVFHIIVIMLALTACTADHEYTPAGTRLK